MVTKSKEYELSTIQNGESTNKNNSNIGKKQSISGNQALKAIDNAKFNWFHVRAVLVSGVGFFTVNHLTVFI